MALKIYKNPLTDEDFLKKLDYYPHKFLWVKIIALNWKEYPVEEITGKTTSGNVNIDGSSAVRRTCSLSLVTEDPNNDKINNILINDLYWSVHSKFKLMVGVENKIDSNYPDIIWFNQGIFIISSFSCTKNTNSYSISLQGKDKMSMLNGDIGGTIPASWDFGKENITQEDGDILTKDIPIKEIIRQAVHEFAQEEWQNIIVNDLDDYGLELLEYTGDIPMYYLIKVQASSDNQSREIYQPIIGDKKISNIKLITLRGNIEEAEDVNIEKSDDWWLGDLEQYGWYDPLNGETIADDELEETKIACIQLEGDTESWYTVAKITRDNGYQVCGYRQCDIIYPYDLIASPGETVTSIFDKIVQMLGNFEYYYDVDGKFIFQKKKIYLDVSYNNIINEHNINAEVWGDNAKVSSKYSYDFDNNTLISSLQNSPNLSNLKNDYSLWGVRKSGDIEIPIHLRYAIDHKPEFYKTLDGEIYYTKNLSEEYKQSLLTKDANEVDWREIIFQMANDYRRHYRDDDFRYLVEINNKKNNYESFCPKGLTGYEKYYIDFEMNLSQGVVAYWRELYNPETINNEGKSKSGRYLENGIFELDDDDKLVPYWNKNNEGGYNKNIRIKCTLEQVSSEYENQLQENEEWYNSELEKIFEKNIEEYDGNPADDVNELWKIYDKKREEIENKINNLKEQFKGKDYLIFRSTKDNNTTVPGAINSNWVVSFGDFTYNDEGWNPDIIGNPELLNFWFDFLDTGGELNKYSVGNIGQRTKATNDDKMKAIYFRDVPNVIFKVEGEEVSDDKWEKSGYCHVTIPKSLNDNYFTISSRGKNAIDILEENLYNYTYPISSITLTTIPIYYLIPNTLIYVNDKSTGISGEYIIEKYSIQFGLNTQMTINAVESPRRLY